MKKKPEITERTRQKIVDAFWQLYCEKGHGNVTVGAVVKRAGYNRSTFYEYFHDTNDVLEHIEAHLIADAKKTMMEKLAQRGETGIAAMFDISIPLAAAFGEQMYVLLSASGDPAFFEKWKKEIESVFRSVLRIPVSDMEFGYIFAYYISSVMEMNKYWRDNGRVYSMEEHFNTIKVLIGTGLIGYLQNETVAKQQSG